MNVAKRDKLTRAGFRVGTVQDFLGLSDEEFALVDLKARLVTMVRATREAAGLRQQDLARRLGSSQSRVAKLEAGGGDVTLDLICRALFALGVSRQRIGKAIASSRAA